MTPTKLTVGAALCAVVLALPAGADAQVSDKWQYGLSLYAYIPEISGTSRFPASGASPGISVSLDELLDLKFAFMGSFEAKKGRWGGFTDFMYLDIGDSDVQSFSSLWLKEILNRKLVPHEYYVFPGYHNEPYWQAHLPDYLRWYIAAW